jgi:NAD(P)-dependent dehydrogenase (short-subunit alcohol dehydrogenase family)
VSRAAGPEASPALHAFDLDGRVALVTGASSGLGPAIARGLAAAGARVAVTARRADRLEALAGEIDGLAVPADLLDVASLDALVERVAEHWGAGPEILCNVAGAISGIHKAEEETLAGIEQTLTIDLVAPFRLSQLAFPHMRAAGRGSIVHLSSISGHVGIPGIPQASYAAAKGGLSGLTRELAVQWARHSIRVNTVAPGFFRSEMTGGMYDDERQHEWLRRNTLLPYDGAPEDLVGVVLWLASDAGRYMTGQTVVVDGGWTAK